MRVSVLSLALLASVCGGLAAHPASAQVPVYLAQWGSAGSAPGQFHEPRGLAVDPTGVVYVADFGNNRIQKFNASGVLLGAWGTAGSNDGQFYGPCAVALDGQGHVYVVENGSNSTVNQHRVQKFDTDGNFITKWGALGHAPGEFNSPYGVAVDASGTVYVADTGNDRIQVFSPEGVLLRMWGTHGVAAGQFRDPFAIAIDSEDDVYVSDAGNSRVQRFKSDGTFVSAWGSGSFYGVTVDSYGECLLAAPVDIQAFSRDGVPLFSWGAPGSGAAQFARAWGVGRDASGFTYVSDSGNNRIQKFGPLATPVHVQSWGALKARLR